MNALLEGMEFKPEDLWTAYKTFSLGDQYHDVEAKATFEETKLAKAWSSPTLPLHRARQKGDWYFRHVTNDWKHVYTWAEAYIAKHFGKECTEKMWLIR